MNRIEFYALQDFIATFRLDAPAPTALQTPFLSGVRYENESQRLPLLAANFIIQVNLPRRCLEKLAR